MNTSPIARVTTLLLLVAVAFGIAPQTYAKTKGFPVTVTASDIKSAYQNSGTDEFRILIVPGHEPQYGGAVYNGVYEREIAVEVANKLKAELEKDPKVEVIVARDNLVWNKDLSTYFKKEMKKIKSFVSKQKKEMKKLVKKKQVTAADDEDQVDHAAAPDDVALRLYGINKWANEHDVDLIVNLHINDAPDHGPTTPGVNSGFAIYIPDAQYGNGAASRPVAEAIAARLGNLSNKSTLRLENQGVVEDQELIAVGAYNTLKVPTVLIEYGYITEAKLREQSIRAVLTSDFAHATYLGLEDFLAGNVTAKYVTTSLPHRWNASLPLGSSGPEVYALQSALHILGFYPPTESTLVECPIAGVMNECTTVAIKAYQKSLGYEETGELGPKTRAALNARFGK